MTSTEQQRVEEIAKAGEYLLVKRGLYYGPNYHGYTGVRDRAGRYHESDARPESGVTAIHQDDAPLFSPACWQDEKVKFLLDQIAERDCEIERLRTHLQGQAS